MPSVLIPDVGVVQFDDSLTGDVLTAEVAKAAKAGLAQKKAQLQGERTSTLGQLPGALLDASDESQALTEAVQANAQRLKGMTPEQIGAENMARFRAQGGGSIPLSSEIQQQNDIAQGITPVVVDAPPNLPKLTSGEAQTLVANPRLANVVKAAQNTASGVADSLVESGIGTGAFGAAEGAIAKAFIPQMLTSGTKAALDSVDAYKAGDLETGDAKAVEALTTGLMLGAPHAVDTILRRQLPEAKLARLIDQAKAKLPSVEEAAQAGGTPISQEPSKEIANPVSEAIPGATAPILTEAKDKALSGAGSTPSESPLTPKTVTASQAEPVEAATSAGPSASGEIKQNPNISLVGEQPIGMGGALADEIPEGGNPDVYGVAQRVREERAKAGQVSPIELGEGINTPDSIERGREILNQDSQAAEKMLSTFEADPNKSISHNLIAVTRAQGERLSLIARNAEERFGTNSEEFKTAWKALSDWDTRTKAIQTEWSKSGMAQQGATDIDTGSFTGLQRAFKQDSGKEFDAAQSAKAQEIAAKVRKAKLDADAARRKLFDQFEQPQSTEPVPPHVKLIADKLKSYFDTRAADALTKIKARRAEGRLFTGIDPEAMIDYADYGASKILAKGIEGAEMTAEWASEMAVEIGDYIKPYLQDIWEASKLSLSKKLSAFAKIPDAAEKVRKLLRFETRDATRRALDAANKVRRESSIRLADAENETRVARTVQERETARVREDAARKALDAADKQARNATLKLARQVNERRLKDAQTPENIQDKTAQKALDAANEVARRATKEAADAENRRRLADTKSKQEVAQLAVDRARKAEREAHTMASDAAIIAARAEVKNRVAKADLPRYVMDKAREYIANGIEDFDEIRSKIATDLGMPVAKITEAFGQDRYAKRAINEVWRKQQVLRRLDQQAKRFLKQAQLPLYRKAIESVPRVLFGLKVGFHGTVALGTHAPMVAFQPRFWATYVRDFGKMYRMVGSPHYYEMQVQDLLRRKNYITARRAGLINDPFQYEDFNSPDVAQYIGRLSGMGNRGYSVLKIIRQDMFDQMWGKLPRTSQLPEVAQALADGINHATGVVKVNAPKGTSTVLFAPRLMMSRVAWLAVDPIKAADTFLNWKTASRGDKVFAINQIKEKAWVAGTLIGALAINQGILSAVGSKQSINLTNPNQSDWLKFKAAGMDIAYGNAMISMARLPVRLYKIRSSDGGKLKNLVYPDEDTYTVLGEYARSQLSPFASLAMNLWLKGDWQNRPLPNSTRSVPKRLRKEGVKPYTWPEFWSEQLAPIPAEEAMKEVWKEGMGMSPEQVTNMRKAMATIAVMGATGARLTDDVHMKK
jgi:hypothetical protein